MLFRAFFRPDHAYLPSLWRGGKYGLIIRAYGGAAILLTLVGTQVLIAFWFNTYQLQFGELVESVPSERARNVLRVLSLLAAIVSVEIIISPLLKGACRIYANWWGVVLASHLHHQFRTMSNPPPNAAQRIEGDTDNFVRTITELSVEGIRAVLMVVFFFNLLLHLSGQVSLYFFDPFPGSLIWCGGILVAFGFAVACCVSRPAVRWESQDRDARALLRNCVVPAESNAFIRRNQAAEFDALLVSAYRVRMALIWKWVPVDSFMEGFAKLLMIVPIGIGLYNFGSGILTWGAMLQMVHAFGEMQSGPAGVLVRQWSKIVDLRACINRLREFESPATNVVELESVILERATTP